MRQKNHGVWANYGFEAEKRWGFTNYGFEFTKEIKGNEAKKSWALNKLWI